MQTQPTDEASRGPPFALLIPRTADRLHTLSPFLMLIHFMSCSPPCSLKPSSSGTLTTTFCRVTQSISRCRARTDLHKIQLMSTDLVVEDLVLGCIPFAVDELKLVICGTCREGMQFHSILVKLFLERPRDPMSQMRRRHRCCNSPTRLVRIQRCSSCFCGCVDAQDMCEVSTGCHQTAVLPNVAFVAIGSGSHPESIRWTFHETHARIRH